MRRFFLLLLIAPFAASAPPPAQDVAAARLSRRVVPDPSAGPLWARFYELGTNRPIFLGRDSVVRSALSEIEFERRNGYAYYGTWPTSLLATDLLRWRAKNSR